MLGVLEIAGFKIKTVCELYKCYRNTPLESFMRKIVNESQDITTKSV